MREGARVSSSAATLLEEFASRAAHVGRVSQ